METLEPTSALGGKHGRRSTLLLILVFLILTIFGLTYVKWWPYFLKAAKALDTHSIGSSILNGPQSDPNASIWQRSWAYSVVYFNAVWKASLLGMIVASMIQVLLPVHWLKRVLGRMSFKSTLIGGTAALPGMMCSCCAAPIAVGMRKQRLSVGASLAFWIGSPMLNPATLVFMTAVLSWKFMVLRLLFGLLLTFGVSYAASRFAEPRRLEEVGIAANDALEAREPSGPFWLQWAKSFAGMFIRIVPAYLITVFLVGLLQQLMLPSWATEGAAATVLFAVIGTLFVIPTAAEIPIVQSFLAIDKGPAAALLITLPAISLPSLVLVSRSFPRKALIFVTLAVMALGIVCGFIGRAWL